MRDLFGPQKKKKKNCAKRNPHSQTRRIEKWEKKIVLIYLMNSHKRNWDKFCGGQLYPVLKPRWKRPSPTSDLIDMGCVKGGQAQHPI